MRIHEFNCFFVCEENHFAKKPREPFMFPVRGHHTFTERHDLVEGIIASISWIISNYQPERTQPSTKWQTILGFGNSQNKCFDQFHVAPPFSCFLIKSLINLYHLRNLRKGLYVDNHLAGDTATTHAVHSAIAALIIARAVYGINAGMTTLFFSCPMGTL